MMLDRFIDIYQQLNRNNLERLEEIYHPSVTFEDPVHRISGLPAMTAYFQALYSHLTHCTFDIQRSLHEGDCACVEWQLRFIHPRLNTGREIRVPGTSWLAFHGDKVIHHRDYMDMGALLYEQLPLLGTLIRRIKTRLAI